VDPLTDVICLRLSEQIAQQFLHRVKHALACQGFGSEIAMIADGGF